MYNFDLIISLRNKFTGIDIESRNNKYPELLQFLELYKTQKGPVPINRRSYRNKNRGKSNGSKNGSKNGNKNKTLYKPVKRNKLKRGENAWVSSTVNVGHNENGKGSEDIIKKYEKIVIGNLNKITKNNIDKIIKIFDSKIREHSDPRLLNILACEILNKICFDKSFYELYIRLYKHIGDIVPEISFGEECDDINFNAILVDLCQIEFEKRGEYLKKIENEVLTRQEEKDYDYELEEYKLKRKIFGIVEMIAYLYRGECIMEDIIHICLLSLINDCLSSELSTYGSSCYCEAFIIMWKIIDRNISNEKSVNSKMRSRSKLSLPLPVFENKRNNTTSKATNTKYITEYAFEISKMYSRRNYILSSKVRFLLDDIYDLFLNKYTWTNIDKIVYVLDKTVDNDNTDVNLDNCGDTNDTEETVSDDDIRDFIIKMEKNVAFYSKKPDLFNFIDSIEKCGIKRGIMSGNIYDRYMKELFSVIMMRCFEYNNTIDIYTNLVKDMVSRGIFNNQNILDGYSYIDEWHDEFIIDFPKMDETIQIFKSIKF